MRREMVILLVLFSVFLAIGCAEDGTNVTEEEEDEVTAIEVTTPAETITPDLNGDMMINETQTPDESAVDETPEGMEE